MGGEQGGNAILDHPGCLCRLWLCPLLLYPLQRCRHMTHRDRKTLIYGLGESGVAAARTLMDRGEEVVVADSNDSEHLRNLVLELGVEGWLGASPEVLNEDFYRIVTSPGIRPHNAVLAAAESRGVPVLSEVALGLSLLKAEAPGTRIAAVTGTNGKTTVADMIRTILEEAGVPHIVAGNSWRALSSCLDGVREAGLLVLEISSFMLHYLEEPGFDVAALLNVRPDHLNWHSSFEEYVSDKLRIFEGQRSVDLALVSSKDSVGRAAVGTLSAEALVVGEGDTALRDGRLFLRGSRLADVSELRFAGAHNHENALFAAAAAQKLGAGLEQIRDALLGYESMPHRMRVGAEVAGVTYVDDSKATNPAAVAAALASLDAPVVLILGGSEKGTDFSEMLPELKTCRAV